jgi:plasmid stability protein
MTLKIELPDDQTAALAAKARARGVSAEEYARQVLANDLELGWLQNAWSEARRTGADALSMDDIDAEIAAARKARRESRLDTGS